MMNFRETCKTIFFCIVSVNLGVSSGIEILGILFAIAFVYLSVKQFANSKKTPESQKIPRYRKTLAYGAIVPCALWWVLTPSVENGVSPYLVFIPAWYLLYLAWLQKRSLGNGGYEVFVVFNGVAALFMGLFQAPRACVLSGAVALLLAVYAFSRPHVALYKRLLFILMFASLCCSSYVGFKYWKHNRYYGGRWAEDYYVKNRVMGFDPAVALGSFSSNYNSKYNNEIVLRIWDTLAPPYLRAAAYEKYVSGIWKLPSVAEKKLFPSRYNVDYAVFETEDSIAALPNIKSVWVQATLDNFGYIFAAPNAVGVASKNTDSLNYFSTNVFVAANGTRSDWYYYVSDSAAAFAVAGERDSAYLQTPEKNKELLDSITTAMQLPLKDSASFNNPDFAVLNLKVIENYFIQNFKYSYVVEGYRTNSKTDPLVRFWKNKEGYCEYYATLAVLLLRHQGIPARYVTGFAHPEHVAGRPYVTFRRRHSHAWAEVYINNNWYIFDPTPPLTELTFAKTSWFASKLEGLKGRFSYILHLLKDGEWRRVVDNWQTVSEQLISSPIPYVILTILLALFAGFKIRKYRKNSISKVISRNAAHWVALLESAEKRLAHLGFARSPGETVSSFANRIEKTLQKADDTIDDSANKKTKKAHEFRKHECSTALKLLSDYEQNRWRK